MLHEDLVQLGWRYRNDPQTWAVRNLMRVDPVPVEDWEPVYVLREQDPEFEGYWNRIRDLETRIKTLETELKEKEKLLSKRSNSDQTSTAPTTRPKSATSKKSSARATKSK